MGPSAVNHLGQFLQQVLLSDARVHVFLKVVLGELVDKLLKVVHGRGGGSSAGGGDGAGGGYAQSAGLGLGGGLQDRAERYREAGYSFSEQ